MERKNVKECNIKEELIKRSDKYPYNLLCMLGESLDSEKLSRNYASNTRFLLDTLALGDDNVKIALEIFKDGIKENIITQKYSISKEELENKKKHLISKIEENLDAIYNGFTNSKISKKGKDEFREIGLSSSIIYNLNRCGLYSIQSIMDIKDTKDLIKKFEKIAIEDRGKVLANLLFALNKNGYNVKRFGYFGEDEIPDNISEKDIIQEIPLVEKNNNAVIEEESSIDKNLDKYIKTLEGKKLMNLELTRAREEFTRIWNGISKKEKIRRPISTKKMEEKIKGLGYGVERSDGGSLVIINKEIYKNRSDVKVTIGKKDSKIFDINGYRYHLTSKLSTNIEISDNTVYGIARIIDSPIPIDFNNPKTLEDNFDMFMHIAGTNREFIQVTWNENSKRWVDKDGGFKVRLDICGEGSPYSFRKEKIKSAKFINKAIGKSNIDKIYNNDLIKAAVKVEKQAGVEYKVLCPNCEKYFSVFIPASIENKTFKVEKPEEFYYCPHCWSKIEIKELEELKIFI